MFRSNRQQTLLHRESRVTKGGGQFDDLKIFNAVQWVSICIGYFEVTRGYVIYYIINTYPQGASK